MEELAAALVGDFAASRPSATTLAFPWSGKVGSSGQTVSPQALSASASPAPSSTGRYERVKNRRRQQQDENGAHLRSSDYGHGAISLRGALAHSGREKSEGASETTPGKPI